MLGAFDQILAFIIFSSVVFLALTAATLFRGPSPKAWWYPAAPIVFIAGCGTLALMLLANRTIPSLIGAGLVLLGLPVRRLMMRAKQGRMIQGPREQGTEGTRRREAEGLRWETSPHLREPCKTLFPRSLCPSFLPFMPL